MTTRSDVLVRAALAGAVTNATQATVPVGQRWIVKTLGGVNFAATATTVTFFVSDSVEGVVNYLFNQSVAAMAPIALSTWTVLQGGDLVLITTSQGPVHFWLSGSRLPAP